MATNFEDDGGYNCEPVDPKKAAKYTCAICHKILRDPVYTACCSTSSYFCNSCLDKHPMKCSTCGQELYAELEYQHEYQYSSRYTDYSTSTYFGSRYSHSNHRSDIAVAISKLEVYCSNKAKGCTWSGTLKQLPDHLNTDPTPVECPQKCGETISFCEIGQHCDDICPNTIVECQFNFCHKTLPRKAIPAHVLTEHIDQLTDHSYDEGLVIRKLEEIEESLKDLQTEIEQLKLSQASLIASPPIQFKMYNFEGLKATKKEWFSSPFYTYPKGYKMCLNIDANGYGDGKDSHVSVFIYLMRGDFDSDLKWPFQGDIVVQLLDQTGEEDDHEEIIRFTKRSGETTTGRVLNKERANGAPGVHTFIAHADLKPKYLRDGCLQLKIVSATVFSL